MSTRRFNSLAEAKRYIYHALYTKPEQKALVGLLQGMLHD
jgi:hypothetical protein